jgi:large-conductance mechanosensitive channel
MDLIKKNFIEFLDYLNRNNLIGMTVSFVLARMVTQMSISMSENIITPILGSIYHTKPDFSVPLLNGNKLKLGAFLSDIIDVLLTIVIFYTLFGNNLKLRN